MNTGGLAEIGSAIDSLGASTCRPRIETITPSRQPRRNDRAVGIGIGAAYVLSFERLAQWFSRLTCVAAGSLPCASISPHPTSAVRRVEDADDSQDSIHDNTDHAPSVGARGSAQRSGVKVLSKVWADPSLVDPVPAFQQRREEAAPP